MTYEMFEELLCEGKNDELIRQSRFINSEKLDNNKGIQMNYDLELDDSTVVQWAFIIEGQA